MMATSMGVCCMAHMCAESPAWANAYAIPAGTLCGLVPKCYDASIANWRRPHVQARPSDDRPDDAPDCDGLDNVFTVHRLHEARDREALLKQVAPSIHAICTGGHTGVKTDDALMARFPGLKIVGNFGVGYDSVDVPAAARRGVVVTNTPDVLTEEVADTTLGLLLSTVREFYQAEKWLRDGRWAKEGDYRLTPASLRDRSVGIVGLGRIGKAIARRWKRSACRSATSAAASRPT